MPDPTPRRNATGRAGGSAVSSGNTSAFGLPVLRGGKTPPPVDAASFDGLDLPTATPPAERAPEAPRMRTVEPDAASFDGLDLPSPGDAKPTVVESITGLFRRLFAGGETTRRRARPAEPTPRAGTPALAPLDPGRDRAVRDAARRVAEATAAIPRPLPTDPRERIVEKRRLMLELKAQREREARDEANAVTIIRRPSRPPGA